MIDMLVIRIPFLQSVVYSRSSLDGDVSYINLSEISSKSGLNLSARNVEYALDGDLTVSGLMHPFESLPSYYSGIAFKVYEGSPNFFPCLEVKASPAKILQGHNVFGTCDLSLCSESLLIPVATGLPLLWDLLDVNSATLSRIDVTFSAKVENQFVAKQVIEQLRNISSGQTKSTRAQTFTSTVNWNEKSRHRSLVAYLKYDEVVRAVESLQSKSVLSEYQKRQYSVLSNPDLLSFSCGLIRFEARLKTRYIQACGLPLNLFDAISYFSNYNGSADELCFTLWQKAFNDVLTSFSGDFMNIYDDSAVFERLKSTYSRTNPSGSISFAKASRLFGFYRRLVNEGYDAVALTMARNTFWRSVTDLVEAGISKSSLMNLNVNNNVVPLVRLINVDFANQRPSWYSEPTLRIA